VAGRTVHAEGGFDPYTFDCNGRAACQNNKDLKHVVNTASYMNTATLGQPRIGRSDLEGTCRNRELDREGISIFPSSIVFHAIQSLKSVVAAGYTNLKLFNAKSDQKSG
jgi:hypothetical protein